MDGSSLLNTPFVQSLNQHLILAQAEVIEQGTEVNSLTNAWQTYGFGAMFILGIFVLPFVLSHLITRAVRMPAHSFRLGLMFAAISGGLLFAWANNFQLTFGPDMKGGTTLVYDIMPDEEGEKLDAGALATALSERINPSGTKEISIRPRGESQIEITVPMVDEFELQKIKDLLVSSGQLEFRIVANTRDHQDVIDLAEQQARENSLPKTDVLGADGKSIGRWFTVQREAEKVQGVYPLKTPVFGDILRETYTGKMITLPQLNMDEDYAFEKWMLQQNIKDVDMLMALEFAGKPYAQVAGDDLASAATEYDKTGQPTVAFRLTQSGASKMLRMTAANQPDGNFHRRMAIIMDGKVLSAPQLNSPISGQGQITGRFTKPEVDFLVNILRSGRLPATLSDLPASENRVGAGLGATTIQKGTTASVWAIIVTFACILLYYRFAGVVASMALIINGLLIFGVMIFIGQPLTLPGLAGLVLTVGMSVDANVLIFERMREEKNKGSATRMAIRNGFDRAFTTIVDSNLTTLIAAIVLYWIGTDQVRGFAVALIIGIATSMFTATFCSRLVFEIAEKLKFVSLSMSDGVGFLKRIFLGNDDVNFMGYRRACVVASVLMVAVGVVATVMRGRDILNIDFTGGTSVTFQLQQPVEQETLREVTKQILTDDGQGRPVQSTLVRVEKPPMDTVYTLVTSIENVDLLSKQLLSGFAKNNAASLVTYRVKAQKEPSPAATGTSIKRSGRLQYVSLQEDASGQEPTTPATETPATETPATETPATETAAETPAAAAAEPASPPATADTTAQPPATEPADAIPPAIAPPAIATPTVTTEYRLEFSGSNDDDPLKPAGDKGAKFDGPTLKTQLLAAAKEAGVELNATLVEVAPDPKPLDWREDDVSGHANWQVSLPVDDASASAVIAKLEQKMQTEPLWLSLSQIGTKVADEMQQRAIAAVLVSLVFIVAYIWFRFQKISYGLAAVVALLHDVMITLGVIALCHWLAGPLSFMLIEDFKIGLTEVAAFLTIIGYSLNDTIVVFDRIREVRGRSPKLDAAMINLSVNQTLSRTLLTSGTTLLTVILLFIFGGEGIHAFAFSLLIGILVGTYSSIFIASPILLWLSNRETGNQRPGVAS